MARVKELLIETDLPAQAHRVALWIEHVETCASSFKRLTQSRPAAFANAHRPDEGNRLTHDPLPCASCLCGELPDSSAFARLNFETLRLASTSRRLAAVGLRIRAILRRRLAVAA